MTNWFGAIADFFRGLWENVVGGKDDDITFEDELASSVDETVTSLDAGDVTVDEVKAALDEFAAYLDVDLALASEPDREALLELFWEDSENRLAPGFDTFAHELGVDIETASSEDMLALYELWGEREQIVEDDDAFVKFLEENFPDASPYEVGEYLDLFRDGKDLNIEVAASFETLDEAMAYVRGVPESILKVAAFNNYFIVLRIYP